jgi:hypothetical protein
MSNERTNKVCKSVMFIVTFGLQAQQLLLCVIAHRKCECFLYYSHHNIHLPLLLLTMCTVKPFNFFGALMLYIVYGFFLLKIFYQTFCPIYININVDYTVICIAITGNKLLCLMHKMLECTAW